MGCADSKDNQIEPQNGRPKYRTCTDTVWLAIYIIFWLFLRERLPNWTEEQKALLKEFCLENKDVLESPKNDTRSIAKKEEAWKLISGNLEGHGFLVSPQRCKEMWHRMKSSAKRNNSQFKRECIATGGGPRPKSPSIEDIELLQTIQSFEDYANNDGDVVIVIAIFSFVYGNPLRVINGFDSFGNTCGVKHNERYSNFPQSGQNMINKPELFYFDVKELRKAIKICVEECPRKPILNRKELYEYYTETRTQLCRYDFNMSLIADPTQNNIDNFFNYLGPCPSFPIYESSPVLHRCVPTGKNAPVKEIYKMLNSWDIAQQFLGDIMATWHIIAMICGIALLISIALITLMHWLTKLVSWLICVLVVVASIGLTAALWYAYYNIRHKSGLNAQYSMLEEFVRNEQAVFTLAILATITMVILLVIVYYLKNKLSGLSALFEEAGECMMNLPGLLIAPIIAFIVLIIFLAFWVLVVVCIATASAPGPSPFNNAMENKAIATSGLPTRNNTDYKTILRVEYTDARTLRSMFWIYVVGLIWTTEFIFACQQFALAAAVAYWYFKKPTTTPTIYAIGKLLKYHLGTVAKGSFVITIFKIPRLILTYLYAKLKKGEDKGSECAKCCLSCCICGFWLLEKFIRFLNHNAYTVVAIESINFCPAAGIAWNAMATNVLQVATINSVGDFILFLGKIVVAALSGLIGILMLKDREGLNFYMAPVILILIFSFFIAHIVLSLFEMVVDTLFLCVCEDKTINGRSGRWAQSNLAKLLGEDPLQPGEEPPIQVVEMMPINKQPFRMTQLPSLESEQLAERFNHHTRI